MTDISGVSARAMLKALVNGTENPEALAEHAKGRLRRKQSALNEALTGWVREHHRFLIQTHLEQLEFLEAHLQQFDERIEQFIQSQSLPPHSEHPAPPSSTCPDGSERWFSWQQALTLLGLLVAVLSCCWQKSG
ncbi:hypothetical protein AVDCRST_MAG81-4647 [uncultured Synechococcales cyanobacterium]|uniref:Uncharacterized protein n=1 Tax=uncultured Synechococcales cyanobacterium TaxID=1936017 RepID=A0A6J4VZ44_9CYAN|nr:hypothetical protein AVDCRST_MAG81-4647 [uncultured Synechococcales cyanobacterium]